jgi:hypothetical protein
MVKNMGSVDRIIRVVLGIAGVVLGITLGGLWWIAAALGAVFLLTSSVSFCPIYALFRVSTRRKTHA